MMYLGLYDEDSDPEGKKFVWVLDTDCPLPNKTKLRVVSSDPYSNNKSGNFVAFDLQEKGGEKVAANVTKLLDRVGIGFAETDRRMR